MDKNLKEIASSIADALHKKGQDSIKEDVLFMKLASYNLDADQVELVKKELIALGIKITEEIPDDPIDDKEFDDIVSQINVNDPVKMYLKDIGKLPLLTAEEERELSKILQEGGEQAAYARSGLSLFFDPWTSRSTRENPVPPARATESADADARDAPKDNTARVKAPKTFHRAPVDGARSRWWQDRPTTSTALWQWDAPL